MLENTARIITETKAGDSRPETVPEKETPEKRKERLVQEFFLNEYRKQEAAKRAVS